MPHIKIIRKIALMVLLLCGLFPLFARDIEITVTDMDLGIPLEGAVIRNWDGSEHVCDIDGKVTLSVPDDRPVVIQGAYPGYENARLSVAPPALAFTLELRLSGVMENRELVIEAARPGVSETKTGRSVAVSEREIAQTGEIGLIEDVMTTIKLLPGVGYAGFFNAMPSIRGGNPGDMVAALDGFYITNPYHWGGGFSIFDPKMIQSAQLSHGVFSTRYGHTVSGLLELAAKKPSSSETEFELGINTSAANMSLSIPLLNRGGVMLMGRITYYDPIIWLAQQMAKGIETAAPNTPLADELKPIHAVRVAPYIRSGTLTANYRFLDNLNLQLTGFGSMDGVGISFDPEALGGADTTMKADFDYTNIRGFLTAGLSWNPRNDMLLKLTAGAGYMDQQLDGDIRLNVVDQKFSDDFIGIYGSILGLSQGDTYDLSSTTSAVGSDSVFDAQGRLDYDWELGNGFLAAAGVQEMFTHYGTTGAQQMLAGTAYSRLSGPDQANLAPFIPSAILNNPALQDRLMVLYPVKFNSDAKNNLFTTSGYTLGEYTTPGSRFSAELGLRVDHFFLAGDGFSMQSQPALNPRLNLDFNVLKNKSFVRSLDLSAGTGLFSSVNNITLIAEKKYGITEFKPDRSWTSVLGAKIGLPRSFSFNIEGYYKYLFDRTYVPAAMEVIGGLDIKPQFDGEGRVWGIDLMLQKMQSRYFDGWISYSYNWVEYRDPNGIIGGAGVDGGTEGNDWYFPGYHRFHNLNLVLNIKPSLRFNIYTRLGLASGQQIEKRVGNKPNSYPVLVYDPDTPSNSNFIQQYYWPTARDEYNRTTPSLLLDIKFSILSGNSAGKTQYEVYFAVENALGLLYTSQGNTSFNQYTGEVSEGGMEASYEIPIPIPSFGFKISY